MFDIIINLVLTSIFLKASAVSSANQALPANMLPLSEKRAEAVIPEKKPDVSSVGVKVTATSFVVVEPESGAIVYEKNAQEARPIASITKLMTALVFLDNNPGWDREVVMESGDYESGSRPILLLGDKVSVKDLFYSMLVASSNEAAKALARSTGLNSEEFAFQMNLRAKILEMNDSKFIEPTGLSSGNQASAEDVVKLVKVAFSHSEVRRAGSTKSYVAKVLNRDAKRNMESTDKILKEDFGTDNSSYKIEFGKTGFINSAGYCFASQVKDERGRKLLIAVLGSSTIYDRFIDTKGLAYWVFNNYDW